MNDNPAHLQRIAELEQLLLQEQTRGRLVRRGQRRFFEQVLAGKSMEATLEALVLAIEAGIDGALCSILLLDAEGKHLLTGAAPSLPAAYNAAIHGVAIGPMVGSCGSAAALDEPVIVTDIDTDPRWAPYAALAQQHGLRACWSVPFHDGKGKVLGTFAFYYRTPRAPTEDELAWIEDSAHLVAVAVEREYTIAALRKSEERLRLFVSAAPLLVFSLDKNGVCTFADGQLLGQLPIAHPRVGASVLEQLAESRPEIVAAMRRCLSGETISATRDIGTHVVDSWYGPVRDEQGAVSGMIAIITDVTERRRAERETKALQEEIIRVQAAALAELSSPLIPIRDDVLVMPLIGTIDAQRADRMLEAMLRGIVEKKARFAILDITGVPVVDTHVADGLIRTAKAAELVGARVILTGIRPGVAQILVELGIDLGRLVTRSTLQSGIAFAEDELRGRGR